MAIQRLLIQKSNVEKVFQIVGSGLSIYLLVYFSIEAFTMNTKPDKPIIEQPAFREFIGVLLAVVIIIATSISLIRSYYRSKYDINDTNAIFQPNKLEFLQLVRNKVIIGLENISHDLIVETGELPYLEETKPISMIEYLLPEFRWDLQAKIKGKTILTLIEIAYQHPSHTTPIELSKSLNIPRSTISREIKKLVSLGYLKSFISDVVLLDARFKNFKITLKGHRFLSNLNETLRIAIEQLKRKEVEEKNPSEIILEV
ncbi:MAG: hypothetical protein ACFFB3_01920 [Candidatus Hodarchaeota archaeon]